MIVGVLALLAATPGAEEQATAARVDALEEVAERPGRFAGRTVKGDAAVVDARVERVGCARGRDCRRPAR